MNADRYSRQVLFDPIGEEGQQRLTDSRVTIVGCGGLGTILADILVRAGVGFVRIVDRDFVETSNLQRQILFDEQDVEDCLPKAEAARRKLVRINSDVEIDAHVDDVIPANVLGLVDDVDLVLDGTDNFETRFLLNDAAVSLDRPWIYGAAAGSEGMVSVVVPGQTPCLTCLFKSAPPPGMAPTCDTSGVVSPIIHVVASIQASEAMKLICRQFEPEAARMWCVDVWAGEFRTFGAARGRNPECRTCGRREFPHLEAEHGSLATTICGRNAVQIAWKEPRKVDFEPLAAVLRKSGEVTFSPFMLKFTAPEATIAVFCNGRAIVEGTNDAGRARELYAKYMG